MRMHANWLLPVKSFVAPWVRVLSGRLALIFNACPRRGDAVGADDLPFAFIVKRASGREKSGNGKHHYPVPGPLETRVDRAPSVQVAPYRRSARNILRANAEHRASRRAI
jgi:hypothetical protein